MAEGTEKREAKIEADGLLARAAQLVAEPSGWTKRELARDRHSRPVSPSSERAVRFCAGGALFRATSERFGINFRLGDVNEEAASEPWVMPLALAHYYLGRAVLLLYVPSAVALSEHTQGGEWRVGLQLRGSAEGSPGNTVADTSWLEVVNTVNDHCAIKHRHIVAGFEVARSIAAINRWKQGGDAPEGTR